VHCVFFRGDNVSRAGTDIMQAEYFSVLRRAFARFGLLHISDD